MSVRHLLLGLLLIGESLWAGPRQVDAYRWTGVERIVAIGDLHGGYDSYLSALQAAGVVDKRGRWIAGETHLVQTGDIPDRGPDTRRIIAHMAGLAKQATRKGGRVHNLMGNHEAMNVYGDLRYLHVGEFEAFADSRSAELRQHYFDALMKDLESRDPQRHAELPADFRGQWERDHPLGWVEHRSAWDPRWNPEGELYQWVMQTKVAIQLNDLIFVHGGISSDYCQNSLESLSTMAHAALRRGEPGQLGILEDQRGPLWYRGLAGVAPAASVEAVDAILERHGARHIVIGHTTTGGVIWPRLDARVIMIDTGIGPAYGGQIGWLEVTPKGLVAGYRGGSLSLPTDDDSRLDYLEAVIALEPDNQALRHRRDALKAGMLEAPAMAETAATCDISE
ncbi:MAG: metallophosphoesterase [Lysobacterales bacterium]